LIIKIELSRKHDRGIILCVYYFDYQISPKIIDFYFHEIDFVYDDNETRAASADGLRGRKYADVQRA